MEKDSIVEGNTPQFIEDCPLVWDWCRYGNEVYFASLNYGESIKRGKPVFDLAYCATKALNGIFLKQRVWSNKFQPETGSSMWSRTSLPSSSKQ